jgi:hypothetical protein
MKFNQPPSSVHVSNGWSQTAASPINLSGTASPLLPFVYISLVLKVLVCQNSVIGIATSYGLKGPGIESPCGRDFPHPSRQTLGPNHPPIKCIRLITGVKRPDSNHLCHIAPSLKKEYNYNSTFPRAIIVCYYLSPSEC